MFTDRRDAGAALASALGALPDDALILALPRGGVPIGYEIAAALGLPLDVLIVRKLGVPGQPELAYGAIGERGVRVLNQDVLDRLAIPHRSRERVERHEAAQLAARARRYRGDDPPLDLVGRTAVIVDDGMATGATAAAAVAVARAAGAARVVMAVPVASTRAVERLGAVADEDVTVLTSDTFDAVGTYYRDFAQVSDTTAAALLEAAR